VILACANVHARFIHLLNCMIVDPPLFAHFSTVYATRIHSLGALQHCNTWISLEFLWNSTYIGTCCLDYQHINGYFIWLSGFMEISHISHDGKPGFTGFNDAYHCMFVIALACCALWLTCDFWNSMGYTNCIHTYSPSLSKYGVYNFSLLIVLCTYSQLCAAPSFS